MRCAICRRSKLPVADYELDGKKVKVCRKCLRY